MMDDRRRRILYRLEQRRQRSQGLREILSFFHFLMMVIGLILLSIGAYTITGNLSQTSSGALLVGGSIMALISFLGCFGTFHEHAAFLQIYCTFSSLVLVAEFTVLSWLYLHAQDTALLDQKMSAVWDFFYQQDTWFLYDIEQWFQCCGYTSPLDRAVPVTCNFSHSGCKTTWIQLGSKWQHPLVIGTLFIFTIQFCLLIVMFVTTSLVEKDDKEEDAQDMLWRQRNDWCHRDLHSRQQHILKQYSASPWSRSLPTSSASSSSNTSNLPSSTQRQPRVINNILGTSPPHYGSVSSR